MSDPTTATLAELRHSLDSKAISAVELTQQYLGKIKEQKELNAFITVSEEQALAQAKSADQRLQKGERTPLLGIPLAIKDVLTTKGVRTTCASKILSNFVPPYDATSVAKLQSAGAISLGKTNMDEFAMGSSTENSAFGLTKNPWDISRVPGGSSGGSSAAVAARLCAAALGSDTGGSVRQPASFCGIVGLKPTYGRISRYGLIAYASSLDQVGIFSQTVKDAATLLQALAGYDPLDATSVEVPVPDYEKELESDISGLRVGVPAEYFVKGIDPEVEQHVRAALSHFEKRGAKLVPINLPSTKAAVASYYIIAPAEASSNLARFDGIRYGHRAEGNLELADLYSRSRSEGFGPEVQRRIMIGAYVLSTGYYDAYYLRAQKVRNVISNEFKRAFATQCDVIACPTAPTTAYKIGEKVSDPLSMYLDDVFTIPVNLAGLPGLSVPCGIDNKGLPIGLQLIGRPWEEATILRAAYRYEQDHDWHKKTPSASK